jgi:hypothetical protein
MDDKTQEERVLAMCHYPAEQLFRKARLQGMVKAPPPTHSTLWDKGTYRTGMGDTFHQPQRPGSDHSYIKSKGDPT